MSTFKVSGNYVSLTFNLENFIESENSRSGRDLTGQLISGMRELGPGEVRQLTCGHTAGLSLKPRVIVYMEIRLVHSVINKHLLSLLCQLLDSADDTAVRGQESLDELPPHLLRLSESLAHITEESLGCH